MAKEVRLALASVSQSLGVPEKKLNETVLNWNVVVKTLTGTEFARFLHDDA